MKFHKYALLAFSLSSLASTAFATREYQEYRENSCLDWCNGCWALEVKGGVVPVVWTGRNHCLNSGVSTSVIALDSFSRFFKIPWTVGAELHYMLSDCSRVYGDFQYRQARAKHHTLSNIVIFSSPGTASVTVLFDKYQSYSGYIGADYLFRGCFCDDADFFIGLKVGATRYRRLNVTLASVACPTLESVNCFARDTVVSAGGRVGFEYTWCDCFAVVLQAEFLAQGGHRNGLVFVPTCSIGQDAVLNGVATEVVFPITLGFKYSF